MRLTHTGKQKLQDALQVVLISYKNSEGQPEWAYIGGRILDCMKIGEEIERGHTPNLETVHIVRQGQGKAPSLQIQKEMWEQYRIRLVSDDQFKSVLKGFFKD